MDILPTTKTTIRIYGYHTILILPYLAIFQCLYPITTLAGEAPLHSTGVDPEGGTAGSTEWDSPFGRSMYPPIDVKACYQHSDHNPGMPLPKLDEQFEARVEAKIVQKGYTVDVEEYYDYPNNRGVVRRMKAGQTSTWIYDFNNYESFLIIDSTCWLSDMRKEGFQFFNFTLSNHGGHIGGVTDLFNFGTQYNETYVSGNETVRGIPVNHWTSCIEWERYGTIFQLDYYFSKQNYLTAIGRKEIPVRATLTGQATTIQEGLHTFQHIYDFTFYRPGPIKDQTVFEVPHGTVCEHKSLEKHRPDLPDSFEMEVEMVQPQDKVISLRKYYYDYKLKLSRYDLWPSPQSMMSWGEKYGYRPLSLIHDYNTGTQYVIDVVSRNCTTDPISMDTVDADPRMTDPSHVIMRHGKELFDLDKLSFSYQGKRVFREINCEVWAALRISWPQEGTNTTVEVYFNKRNWTTELEMTGTKPPVIIGLWLTLVDSTDNYHSEWINHIYGYRSGDPDLVHFDTSDCYTQDQKLHASLQIKESYPGLVQRGLSFLVQSAQLQLSHMMGISPMRVTSLKFVSSDIETTEIIFTILEETKIRDLTKTGPQVTALEAFQILSNKATNTDKDFTLKVSYPDNLQTYKIVKCSLKRLNEESADAASKVQTHTGHHYSSGSMAGLGITMLLIGVVTGAIIMYFHKYKKRPLDIPYRVQD